MRGILKVCGDVARGFFLRVREWCGDAAYERYQKAVMRKKTACSLTPQQFYVEQLERKYSCPSRCC